MDKKTLNNEIVLCRAAVRKARVAVFRKLIKQLKILKSCKKEVIKEKKVKKSERLFKVAQIIKKARDDDVTRFALQNSDLDKYIKGNRIDLRQNALARLAKHDAIVKKVVAIRNKIPNFEAELPLLLNSLEKKKKKFRERIKEGEEEKEQNKTKRNVSNVPKESKFQKQKEKIKKPKQKEVIELSRLEKVDDPFFMGKKVIVPKLLDNQEETKSTKVDIERDRFNKDSYNSIFNAKPFKLKKEATFAIKIPKHATESEEKLHPSWAAKKVKLIKPFEGKKIKFCDE